jgi:hypothetical protein
MRVTYPYNNDIVVVEEFVSPIEIDMALTYFNMFFKTGLVDLPPEKYDDLKVDIKDLFNDLQQRAEQVFYEVFDDLDVEFTPLYNFSRLRTGGISPHADDCQPGATQTVLYGSILYWNGDFEGGELSYPGLGIDYKPVAGDLVFHPGTIEYTHGVKDVTSGVRYTSTTFIKSPL